jgi:2'-5' RNA ligase
MFAACRLDHRTAIELDDALAPLRAVLSDQHFRWVAAENFHVTLRFFGEESSDAATEIGSLIETAARAESPFSCRTAPPMALPSARRPSVVALPIESNGRLERLAATCNDAFAAPFGAPDKPFRAHVTVVRCRPGVRFRAVAAADSPIAFPFAISTVGLYESTHAAGRVRYAALYEFALGRIGRT